MGIGHGIVGLGRALTDLLWPRCCEVCGRRLAGGERVMCLHCELSMPLTGLHMSPDFNEIHERLASHPPIARAASLMYYIHNDPYTHLILNAKYNGRPSILHYLGRRYGRMLADSGFLDGVDMIEPVPMHWYKLVRRGYNQTDWLARGISEASGLTVGDHLGVRRHHASQTRKKRLERWSSASRSYISIDSDEVAGKHILLVDDVITTGATIATCARLLTECAPDVKVSVASIALTHLY